VMPLVIELQMVDTDGTPNGRVTRLPADMWNLGPRFTFRHRGRDRVVRVTVDPNEAMPDIDRGNNLWAR